VAGGDATARSSSRGALRPHRDLVGGRCGLPPTQRGHRSRRWPPPGVSPPSRPPGRSPLVSTLHGRP